MRRCALAFGVLTLRRDNSAASPCHAQVGEYRFTGMHRAAAHGLAELINGCALSLVSAVCAACLQRNKVYVGIQISTSSVPECMAPVNCLDAHRATSRTRSWRWVSCMALLRDPGWCLTLAEPCNKFRPSTTREGIHRRTPLLQARLSESIAICVLKLVALPCAPMRPLPLLTRRQNALPALVLPSPRDKQG